MVDNFRMFSFDQKSSHHTRMARIGKHWTGKNLALKRRGATWYAKHTQYSHTPIGNTPPLKHTHTHMGAALTHTHTHTHAHTGAAVTHAHTATETTWKMFMVDEWFLYDLVPNANIQRVLKERKEGETLGRSLSTAGRHFNQRDLPNDVKRL